MFTLRVFTRKPTGKNYPAALGNSVHFAVCSDGSDAFNYSFWLPY